MLQSFRMLSWQCLFLNWWSLTFFIHVTIQGFPEGNVRKLVIKMTRVPLTLKNKKIKSLPLCQITCQMSRVLTLWQHLSFTQPAKSYTESYEYIMSFESTIQWTTFRVKKGTSTGKKSTGIWLPATNAYTTSPVSGTYTKSALSMRLLLRERVNF